MIVDLKNNRKEFYKALMGEDELGLVVRAHIYVEHELIEFIKQHCEPCAKAKEAYASRVRRAINLGLSKMLKGPLEELGSIRNAFAHRLDASLTESVVQKLHETFDNDMKLGIQHSYDSLLTNSCESKQPAHYTQLSPKDRFVLYARSRCVQHRRHGQNNIHFSSADL